MVRARACRRTPDRAWVLTQGRGPRLTLRSAVFWRRRPRRAASRVGARLRVPWSLGAAEIDAGRAETALRAALPMTHRVALALAPLRFIGVGRAELGLDDGGVRGHVVRSWLCLEAMGSMTPRRSSSPRGGDSSAHGCTMRGDRLPHPCSGRGFAGGCDQEGAGPDGAGRR